MATRNQTVSVQAPSDNDDLPEVNLPPMDSPEEFETDLPDYEPGHTTVVTMSWEELNDLSTESSTDEAEWQKLNPPMRVDYIKEDKWEFNASDDPSRGVRKDHYINPNDKQQGDLSPEGRIYLSFRGYCKPHMHQGHLYTPLFTLRLSPDKREKEDKNGKMVVDSAHLRYLEVTNAYLAYHGETLDKRQKGFLTRLVNFVVNDPFKVNHFNGDNGPFVNKVKPVYQKR